MADQRADSVIRRSTRRSATQVSNERGRDVKGYGGGQ